MTGFWPGCSQFSIEIPGCAAKIIVAKRLKYIEMLFVRLYCEFVGNYTVSLISRVESRSPAFTRNVDAFTPFSCSMSASGGISHVAPFVGDCTE